MGMDIDISNLEGNLKLYARLADGNSGNGNDKIDTEKELSIFKGHAQTAVQNGEVTEADYKAVFGSEIKTPAPQTAKAPVSNPVILSKREEKNYRSDVKKSVSEMVKNGVRAENLMAELHDKHRAGTYEKILEDVADTLKLVNNVINDKDPNKSGKDKVENIHKTVKAQLKQDGKWDDFHKDLLDSLEDQAKTAQIGKESETLIKKYEAVKAKMQDTDVVKQNGDNFKAYVEIVKDKLKKDKTWKESYTKEAFEQLEDYARKDAQRVQEHRLAHNTHATTKKGIKKELRGMNKSDDKYQNKAIKKLIKGADGKNFARKHEVDNRANELSHIDREALKTEFGKRGYQYNFAKKASAHSIGDRIFRKLESYLDEKCKNEDGTYNLTKLSNEILSRVGADYKLDLSNGDDMDELVNVKSRLKDITNGVEFSTNEAKVLVNMLGFDREHKDHTPKVVKAVGGLIGGAGAALSASSKFNVTQEVAMEIADEQVAQDIIKQLKDKGVTFGTTKIDGKIGITVLQKYMRDNTITNILKGAGIGVLSNALFDIVFGNKPDKYSCVSVSDYDHKDPYYTTPKGYKKHIADRFKNANKKEALNKLVDLYVEKYGEKDWSKHFQNDAIRRTAGFGSTLTPEECVMLKYNKPIDDTPVKPPVNPDGTVQPPQQDTVPPTNPGNNPEVQEAKENCHVEYKEDIKMADSNKFEWKNIVKMYYSNCLKTHSISEITTKIKKYNNIPMNLKYIPAGIVLPYDLFGDGECTRTERQDVKQGKVEQAKKVKKFNGQLGDAGVQARNVCQYRDGSYTATEWTKRHKDRAGAEQEARDNGWIQ